MRRIIYILVFMLSVVARTAAAGQCSYPASLPLDNNNVTELHGLPSHSDQSINHQESVHRQSGDLPSNQLSSLQVCNQVAVFLYNSQILLLNKHIERLLSHYFSINVKRRVAIYQHYACSIHAGAHYYVYTLRHIRI